MADFLVDTFDSLATSTFASLAAPTFDEQSAWMKDNIYTPALKANAMFGFSITGGGANIIDLLNRPSSSSCFMFGNMLYATYESYRYGKKYMDTLCAFDQREGHLKLLHGDHKKLESVSPALAYTLALGGKDLLKEINDNFDESKQKDKLISVSFSADYGSTGTTLTYPRFCAHVIVCDKSGNITSSDSYALVLNDMTTRKAFNDHIVANILTLLKGYITNSNLPTENIEERDKLSFRKILEKYKAGKLLKVLNDTNIAKIDRDLKSKANASTLGGGRKSRRKRKNIKQKTKSRNN